MLLLTVSADGPQFGPFAIFAVALVLDAALGELKALPRWLPHPVRIIGGAVFWFDRKLNREQRGNAARRVRGFLVTVLIGSASAGVGWAVAWLSHHHDFGWIPELILVTALLAQRSLYDHVAAVSKALRHSGLQGGRDAVAHIVGRDVGRLDEHGVARAAVESCAENFSDGVVAPTLWYLAFGLPGLLTYKAVNTMDSMIGYKSPRYRAFGWAAARFDDAMNWIPARLAGLYLCCAAGFVRGAHARPAFATMIRDAAKSRSPNAGWPEAAAAGALGLALAGPRRYVARVVDDPWIGSGRARVTADDIDASLMLHRAGCCINALVFIGTAAGYNWLA